MPRKSPHAGSSDLVALGRALRDLRERRGVPQEAVGYDAGVARSYVSMAELGFLNPSFVTLLGIVRTLRFPLSELVEAYDRELERIDRHAGHEIPASPTPQATAHVRRLADASAAAYHAAKARRARGRIRSWT